jgi:hypothetical protein
MNSQPAVKRISMKKPCRPYIYSLSHSARFEVPCCIRDARSISAPAEEDHHNSHHHQHKAYLACYGYYTAESSQIFVSLPNNVFFYVLRFKMFGMISHLIL